jgi:hypothetical protein
MQWKTNAYHADLKAGETFTMPIFPNVQRIETWSSLSSKCTLEAGTHMNTITGGAPNYGTWTWTPLMPVHDELALTIENMDDSHEARFYVTLYSVTD